MTEINLCNEVLENAIGVYRTLEEIEPLNPMNAVAVQAMEELLKYRAIGTIEEFKALKEKATPKKGIPYTSSNNHKFVECPSCHKDMDLYYDFCQHCGQSVDWGKTKT